MEAMMNSIQAELEGTNNNCVEGILASVEHWTQSPCEEFSIEIADAKQDLHEELNLRIQGTESDIQATKNLVQAMWHGL
jgi:hypothetical protein